MVFTPLRFDPIGTAPVDKTSRILIFLKVDPFSPFVGERCERWTPELADDLSKEGFLHFDPSMAGIAVHVKGLGLGLGLGHRF